MTYTTPEDLSSLTAESSPTTFDKAKVLYREGLARSQRIGKILKAAFSQTAAEFKAGRQTLSPLAQEVTAETMASVKEQSQKAAEVLNDAWAKEAGSQDLSERISRFLSAIAQSVSQSTKTQLLPQLKTQASKLDGLLRDRYGDRYENIRIQFEKARSWQAASKDAASTKPEATTVYDADMRADEGIVIEVDSKIVS